MGAPIDMLRYETDSFSTAQFVTFQDDNAYWRGLRQDYADGLAALVDRLPAPPLAVG